MSILKCIGSKCTYTKLRQNENWTDKDLNAAMLVVGDGLLLKQWLDFMEFLQHLYVTMSLRKQ